MPDDTLLAHIYRDITLKVTQDQRSKARITCASFAKDSEDLVLLLHMLDLLEE